MNELSKIFKIVDKEFSGAKIDIYLVIDSTTGQNEIIQAKLFAETCDINGLIHYMLMLRLKMVHGI